MVLVRSIYIVCWLTLVLPGATFSQNEEQKADTEPEVSALGGERFKIGKITVDKAAGKFTVSGRVLRLEPPLEYLAVTRGGTKGYESLLELDSNAAEFNLACILIGLNNEKVTLPRYQFDQEEVIGPRVQITAIVQRDGKPVEVDAAKLLLDGENSTSAEWVYTGSVHSEGEGETYMAEMLGTLIGLAHDPASIIEHRTGLGINAYGSIGGNTKLLSTVNAPVTLTIENADH
jgi:hypothetical protein